MNKLIINPDLEKLILSLSQNLPQSLLLTGRPGVGLTTVAEYIAGLCHVQPIVVLPEKDNKIDVNGIISVDIIRRLNGELKTKSSNKRIIIIDSAERITEQAQNAFLKLLEEPNQFTYFIIAAHSTTNLLPTILSRVTKVNIKPISTDQSEQLINQLGIVDKRKRVQLLFMADGLPAELTRLCQDELYFNKRSQTIRDARDLLNGKLYQKLLIAQAYRENRSLAMTLIDDTANILNRSILAKPQPEAINQLSIVLDTYRRIEANGNIRLAIAQMVI
jgi:DNA polymerase-3 subunit delta'